MLWVVFSKESGANCQIGSTFMKKNNLKQSGRHPILPEGTADRIISTINSQPNLGSKSLTRFNLQFLFPPRNSIFLLHLFIVTNRTQIWGGYTFRPPQIGCFQKLWGGNLGGISPPIGGDIPPKLPPPKLFENLDFGCDEKCIPPKFGCDWILWSNCHGDLL